MKTASPSVRRGEGGRYTSFIYANGVSVLLLIYGMGSAKAPIDG